MKLNFGVGDHKLEGFVNTDIRQIPEADVVCDVFDLQEKLGFADGTIEEIYCGHFLEHLYIPKIQELLKLVVKWLQPGGTIWIVIPDFKKLFNLLVVEQNNYALYNKFVMGLPVDRQPTIAEFPYCHHTLMDDTFTLELALEAGLDAQIVPITEVPMSPDYIGWQSAVKGVKK